MVMEKNDMVLRRRWIQTIPGRGRLLLRPRVEAASPSYPRPTRSPGLPVGTLGALNHS